jgi:hypothetical protein
VTEHACLLTSFCQWRLLAARGAVFAHTLNFDEHAASSNVAVNAQP